MGKEKVTLTLDTRRLAELRAQVGGRSISAAVDAAREGYLVRRRHLRAVDDWLAELDREHGQVPSETLEWATHLIDGWEAGRARGKRSVD